LIGYTIEAAKRAQTVSRVIVSTDDEEIAEVAEAEGAEVPFRRPAEFAEDASTVEATLQHAVQWLRDQGRMPSIVVYLQITDPFRSPAMIDRCVQTLLSDPGIDSAFMALVTHKNYWRQSRDGWERLAADIPYGVPRQEREPVYREDTGLALATRASVILRGQRLGERCIAIGHDHPAGFVDIHTEFDLRLAEAVIEQLGIHPNEDDQSNV